MRDSQPSIVVAPEPLLTESPASWILRICRMHEISYSKLLKIFHLPCYVDPDVALDGPTLCRVAAGTTVSQSDMLRLGFVFRSIRATPRLGVMLYRDEKGTPAYRFCDQCLASDKHPYLRLEWRVAGWKTCAIHRVRLKDRCWRCSAAVLANQISLRGGRYGLTLANCAQCLADLADNEHVKDSELDDGNLSFQASLVSAILHGYFQIPGCDIQLPLGFLAWLIETNQCSPLVQRQQTSSMEPPLIKAIIHGLYSTYTQRPLHRGWFSEAHELANC